MDKKVNIIEKRLVLDDFFKVEKVRLQHELFSGEMSPTLSRLNLERGDSVAAILWNKTTEKLMLTYQFRYPTYAKNSGWILELIAGGVKQGEDPEEALKREIVEETGYRVQTLKLLTTFYVSPGGTSERIILYYGEVTSSDKVAEGGGLANEQEDIQVREMTLDELWEAFTNQEIVDAKTIIGLMFLKRDLLSK